jgi:hypothetical protein
MTKPARGRPPKAEGDVFVQGSLRLNAAQWDEFSKVGGVDWLRGVLDRRIRKDQQK